MSPEISWKNRIKSQETLHWMGCCRIKLAGLCAAEPQPCNPWKLKFGASWHWNKLDCLVEIEIERH